MIGYDEIKRKSNRALEAEENGFKKEHVFSRMNKMDRDILKVISSVYFGLIDREWHHTGKKFNVSFYFRWSDDSFKAIYSARKNEVDELVNAYNLKIAALGETPNESTPLKERDRYYIALNDLETTELPELVKAVKKIFGI